MKIANTYGAALAPSNLLINLLLVMVTIFIYTNPKMKKIIVPIVVPSFTLGSISEVIKVNVPEIINNPVR